MIDGFANAIAAGHKVRNLREWSTRIAGEALGFGGVAVETRAADGEWFYYGPTWAGVAVLQDLNRRHEPVNLDAAQAEFTSVVGAINSAAARVLGERIRPVLAELLGIPD